MAEFKYRLEKAKENKYFLVRNASFKGRHGKVRKYLGTTEDIWEDLNKNIVEYSYELEIKAAENVADMAFAYYISDYMNESVIKEIEQLRFLYNSYTGALNKTELDVYLENSEVVYIHGTTAIEGNTLTISDTRKLLNEDIIPDKKELREIHEVKNYKKVQLYREKHKGKINLAFIRKLHSLVMDNIDYETAGVFRKADNIFIYGRDIIPTPVDLIEDELQESINVFYENIKNKKNPFEQAILFHYGFEKIHPFTDGNGRTGREILNFLLEKEGYPRLIILKESRKDYLSALERGDENKHIEMVNTFAKLALDFYSPMLADLRNVLIPAKGQTTLTNFDDDPNRSKSN
jgi:fido (protein-threonine AMPylation protein)